MCRLCIGYNHVDVEYRAQLMPIYNCIVVLKFQHRCYLITQWYIILYVAADYGMRSTLYRIP